MTFAQFVGDGNTGIIGAVDAVVVPAIFGLVFLVFVWGIVKYFFLHSDDETKRAEGRNFALWGLIGMLVLFSVWGLVNLLLSTLGINPTP